MKTTNAVSFHLYEYLEQVIHRDPRADQRLPGAKGRGEWGVTT